MSEQAVLFSVKNAVATVTLNQPKSMNALSHEIVQGLRDSVTKIQSTPEIRAVVLTGSGRAFSAGGDISTFPEVTNGNVGRSYMLSVSSFLTDLHELDRPVIAAVNGFAVGAGFSLALASDFVIASDQSKFGLAFSNVGLVPDLGALYFLPRVVGMQKAKELAYSAKILTAEEAKEYGICLEVVSHGQLLDRAQEIAEKYAMGPAISVGLTKSILNQSFESSLGKVLKEEAMAQGIAFTTSDHKEGVNAFFNKKSPVFSGQ